MRISVEPEVFEAFPEAAVAGIVLHGLHNAGAPEPTVDVDAAGRPVWTPQRPDEALEGRLDAWNEAYRKLGVNPKRNRPSAAALLNQVVKRGTLASISPVVDAYNKVSLKHLVPIGGYDLAALSGDVRLTRADGGELFSPLPAGAPDEVVDAGEIVYRDDKRVLTRRWNFRDGAVSAIQPQSTSILLFAELPDATIPVGVLDDVMSDLSAELAAAGGREAARFTLSALLPTVTVG